MQKHTLETLGTRGTLLMMMTHNHKSETTAQYRYLVE